MFKFPYKWLEKESEIPVDYNRLMQWLTEQGFEIESLTDVEDDKLIEIEVKANRPDMLSVAGVLREYYCACNKRECKRFELDNLNLDYSPDFSPLGHRIVINSSDVHRYYAVAITDVNNELETPEYIAENLRKLGVSLISPIVDISNYVMLLIGQPTHVFDADKLKGDIVVSNCKDETSFISLTGQNCLFPKNTLFIQDEEGLLCAAGIIGGKRAEVTSSTKNIIIESANFDHVIQRIASKKSHVSTLSSYRFERGVSVDTAKLGCDLVAYLINQICGGKLCVNVFEYSDAKSDSHTLELSVEHTNRLLGSNLTVEQIVDNLERCFFKVKRPYSNTLLVDIPSFRLDVDDPVDLIEEVGRIYGYHNIEPQPVKLNISLKPNALHLLTKRLRDIMVGFGGIECLTYGFIPDNSMEILGINNSNKRFYGDIKILNPLSNYYALMRPTMAYNVLSTAIDNVKRGCKKINIFELGKTYYQDNNNADGYNQRSTLAGVLYGVNQSKGYGIIKDNMYSIYDILGLIKSLMSEFNISYDIRKTTDLKFLREGASAYIYIGNVLSGCVGIIDSALYEKFGVEKIINSDMLYFELDYDNLIETKKAILHERVYDSVKREYNFIVKNGTYFADYKHAILSASKNIIGVKPIDVYTGKGVEKGTTAVLIEVEYNDSNRNMELSEIEAIEQAFYSRLKAEYDIVLKM